MSHTVDESASYREIERFADRLTELGVSCRHQIQGCTDEEVEGVVHHAGELKLPAPYIGFLRRMGRGAGSLFRGTSIYYPEPLEVNDYARKFAEEDDPGLSTEGRFFFAHHQGYQLYFFDSESGTVFLHTEGDNEPEILANDFLEFLWKEVHRIENSSFTGYAAPKCTQC